MFTGLIQALGTIKPLGGDSWQITCVSQSLSIMQDLAYGDSVAVDGVCLTVEEILKDGFIASASPETLRRTTLGTEQAQQGYVNLETSLRVGGKVGGHFVMGHVDGVGQLLGLEKTATSWEMTFTAPEAIARYIVPKGSITVNGISLTVAAYEPELSQFTVAVIPLTYAETNLRYLVPGSLVNLEGDILGKYVEKFLQPGHRHSNNTDITPAFLVEHGYM
ncbi:riboflavin synthase alpha chain [Nostoc sp. NIES-3756]|uniref:riboflavin synthase n=1 Tax=Nostoc sp. NIES-3756 TaxID=1751286 RepID=UPI000721044C|nr:riboflavin synthase [Nostoc sp. NIES-3756]BAT51554.1 riboflavin synthase alpha chain [Nostoc sp. NIES-3756]BAY40725.1 riboflavin synthase alpha chain [Nostoc sp. NIES-2111]